MHPYLRYVSAVLMLLAAVALLQTTGCGESATPDRTGKLFTGFIVDDETGEPVAATVHLIGPDGEPLVPAGDPEHVAYLDATWYYQDATFKVPNAPNTFTLAVRRGPEYLPFRQTVHLRFGTEQTFRIRRWTHQREQQWISGDTHIHYLSRESTMLRMRAEDLRVGNLLVSDFTNDREKFTGSLDTISTADYALYVGQEFRDWDMGHINLLRLGAIVEPFAPAGGEWKGKREPNYVLSRVAREARAQGAIVTFAHFSDIPGIETPIMVANGELDALDLITQSDPMGPVKHKRPWQHGGMSRREFPERRGIDLWYTFLNAGQILPISAGTDRMNDRIPIGSIRHYVRCPEPWNYDTWVEGIRAGRGFVTNAPMLDFQVENWQPGHVETYRSASPRKLFTRATVGSVLPFDRLEIVQNGEVIAVSEPVPDADGVHRAHITVSVNLTESAWFAARAVSDRDSSNMILPRHHTVFAHTNPVWVHLGGAPVRSARARRYLATWVRASQHFLTTQARFRTPEEAAEIRELAQQANFVYSEQAEEGDGVPVTGDGQ